jgi:hypothetical protein
VILPCAPILWGPEDYRITEWSNPGLGFCASFGQAPGRTRISKVGMSVCWPGRVSQFHSSNLPASPPILQIYYLNKPFLLSFPPFKSKSTRKHIRRPSIKSHPLEVPPSPEPLPLGWRGGSGSCVWPYCSPFQRYRWRLTLPRPSTSRPRVSSSSPYLSTQLIADNLTDGGYSSSWIQSEDVKVFSKSPYFFLPTLPHRRYVYKSACTEGKVLDLSIVKRRRFVLSKVSKPPLLWPRIS